MFVLGVASCIVCTVSSLLLMCDCCVFQHACISVGGSARDFGCGVCVFGSYALHRVYVLPCELRLVLCAVLIVSCVSVIVQHALLIV